MVNEEVFYDTKSVPFSDRESFNNTILLLTMVKSKYYYIIGFSRPDESITIGFDFETKTEERYTRELTVDFGKSDDDIVLSCDVAEIAEFDAEKLTVITNKFEHFYLDNEMLRYEYRISKDTSLPSSVNAMNHYLLSARNELEMFLQECYYKLSNERRKN